MQNNKEIKCRICGKTDSLDRWVECDETKIMEKENVCFHCAFWLEKIATANENTVVVNGIRYTIGKEDTYLFSKDLGEESLILNSSMVEK